MTDITPSPNALRARRERLRKSTKSYGLDYVKYCKRSSNSYALTVVFLGTIPETIRSNPADALLLHRSGQSEPIALTNHEKSNPSRPSQPVDELTVQLPSYFNIDSCDYQLSIKGPASQDKDPEVPSVDPFFRSITFKFDHDQPAPSDCVDLISDQPSSTCASDPSPLLADINYLAKDYASFRKLIFDRLSVTMPDWQERCPADIGVMLVEILAYAADHLSYYQDAVATEAYLTTARLRTSLRRHARLVDYRLSEGCNARAWVHLDVNANVTLKPKQLFFLSLPRSSQSTSQQIEFKNLEAVAAKPGCQVFEPVVSKEFNFYPSHNEIRFHDWGGVTPCIPCNATEAFLVNQKLTQDAKPNEAQTPARSELRSEPSDTDWLQLNVGDVILLQEQISPWTGNTFDADPAHRHPVRITHVEYGHLDRLEGNGLPLVKVRWHREDALPFTLWIGKPPTADWPEGSAPTGPLAVALGNMLLVDHGQQVRTTVKMEVNVARSHDELLNRESLHYPPHKVQGQLAAPHLTFASPLPPSRFSAAAQLRHSPKTAIPQVVLQPKQIGNTNNLLNNVSIHELQDSVRIAKRLIKQTLTRSGNPPASSSDTTNPDPASGCDPYITLKSPLDRLCDCVDEIAGQESLLAVRQIRNTLTETLRDLWLAVTDLLDCDADDARFVVEMTDDRIARLRFGGNGFGREPHLSDDPNDSEMIAHYRVGNGTSGNVAAETIRSFGFYHFDSPSDSAINQVWNPLPAVGGADPESPTEVALYAPHALRSQLRRACIPSDYDKIALAEFSDYLQAVRTSFHWTGHEIAAMVAVDPIGDCLPAEISDRILRTLTRYRRIGHSVRVLRAKRVIPVVGITVTIPCHIPKSPVAAKLNDLFSSRKLQGNDLGYFHPDRATFGDGIAVSDLVAVSSRLLGRDAVSVQVTALHRSDIGPAAELQRGLLPLRPLEIIRFDNNPRTPQFGTLDLSIIGGR